MDAISAELDFVSEDSKKRKLDLEGLQQTLFIDVPNVNSLE